MSRAKCIKKDAPPCLFAYTKRRNAEDGCEHAKSFALRTSRFLSISSTGKLQFPRPLSTLWSSHVLLAFLPMQKDAMRRTGASSKVKVLCECCRPPRCVLRSFKRSRTASIFACGIFIKRSMCMYHRKTISLENQKPLFRAVFGNFHVLGTTQSHECVALTESLYGAWHGVQACYHAERGAK